MPARREVSGLRRGRRDAGGPDDVANPQPAPWPAGYSRRQSPAHRRLAPDRHPV